MTETNKPDAHGAPIALSVRDLTKHYADAAHNVFDGISFDVPKGKVLVVVGPSGSGKSTLLRTIAGLEPIQGGTIALNGDVIETGQPGNEKGGRVKRGEDLRTKFGMVFQSYDLFPNKDVLGNITMAPMLVQKRKKEEVEREALELLDRVHLADRADAKPHELSGGQRQRVAICRALMMEPELLLLDEITSALDPLLVGEVLEMVGELKRQGATILMATHEMSFAHDAADRIVLLRRGKIAENGSPEEVMDNPTDPETQAFFAAYNRV